MTVTFKTDDPKEIQRLAKSEDMAIVLFEIQANVWRPFKDREDLTVEEVWEAINDIYEAHGIDMNDLIE